MRHLYAPIHHTTYTYRSHLTNIWLQHFSVLSGQDKGHDESDTLYQLAWNEYQDVQSSLQQAVSDFDSLPCTNPGCSHHVSPKVTPKKYSPPSPTQEKFSAKRKDDDDFEFPQSEKLLAKLSCRIPKRLELKTNSFSSPQCYY
ncbi:hypothetical protein TNCV_20081 [Trichonephila clavipes]|nr:hypothetical protein TNCV_20081 [Trichonephila clavipes]